MDREPVGQHFDGAWEVFVNDSGEEIPAHAILEINGHVQTGQQIMYRMQKPTQFGARWHHRVNGPHPVAIGWYGLCRLSGLAAAAYDVTDGIPAIGELWGPRSGSWYLRALTGGWRIVGGASNGVVYVTHEPQQTIVGKTDAAITKATSGTVSVYWSAPVGSLTDTSVNVTAYSRYGSIQVNKFVTLNWNGWGWEIIAAECST